MTMSPLLSLISFIVLLVGFMFALAATYVFCYRLVFTHWIAEYLVDASENTIPYTEAFKRAWGIMSFLDEQDCGFTDRQFAWTREAAHEVAQEVEVDYWEG